MSSPSSASTRTIVAILIVVAVATAFWILLLAPKREEASALSAEVEAQQSSLALAQSQVAQAETARHDFAKDYHQLVVLGKAVPAGDESASLLVEINRVADHAGVTFERLQLNSGEAVPPTTTAPEASATSSVSTAETVPPTEAEASLLPLGATIGSAGLGVMPYELSFTGNFFQIADFIHGVDALVHTEKSSVAVDGRLVTLDGFSLTEASKTTLNASFTVTTYLVPPGQGTTAGASPTAPAESVPAASVETPNPSTEAR